MKTSKHWAINSSFHTISCDMSGRGKTKTGPGHRQFSLYQSLRYEWSGQNQNKMTWPREDWGYFFFLFLAFRGGHAVKRRGKQNTISNKVQESNHWPNYFCISVWQIEFWTGMSSPSSHPAMFCTYTHFSCCFLAVFLSFCFLFFLVKFDPLPVGFIKDTSSKVATEDTPMKWYCFYHLIWNLHMNVTGIVSGLVLRELQRKKFKQL